MFFNDVKKGRSNHKLTKAKPPLKNIIHPDLFALLIGIV